MGKINTKTMSLNEKRWFAYAIASMVCVDGRVDPQEQAYLKHAIAFLNNKKEITTLLQKVQTQDISELWPIRFQPQVAMDILKHLAGLTVIDGELSELEIDYFQHIGRLLGVSNERTEKILQLVAQQLKSIDPLNNSLLRRMVECFVCGETDFFFWLLRPDCMKPKVNVLGVPIYTEALPEKTFCDYNLIQVAVCPNCFFASNDSRCFRSNPRQTPFFDTGAFQLKWEELSESLPAQLPNKFSNLLESKRTVPEAVVAYDLAIATHSILEQLTTSPEHLFKSAELRLTQAEILMSNKQKDIAEAHVKKTIDEFNAGLPQFPPTLKEKAERYLHLINLYFKEYDGFH